jgi:hypothetical protein
MMVPIKIEIFDDMIKRLRLAPGRKDSRSTWRSGLKNVGRHKQLWIISKYNELRSDDEQERAFYHSPHSGFIRALPWR